MPLKGRFSIGRTWGHSGGHAYPAIDFEVPAGTSVPVYAAGPGTVIDAFGDCADTSPGGRNVDCNGGRGNFVEIVHYDGRRSRYLHLRSGSVTVEAGEHVCRGCQIGRSGWSGNVSPPGPEGGHLHYEELQGFEIVDPGPMRARHGTRRFSYPRSSRTWQEVGREGLIMTNSGFPRPDPTPIPHCLGWAATRVGTPGSDDLRGTTGPDIIVGGDGNDTIRGIEADDRLCGGPGDDLLSGGPQQDMLDGGEGIDTCFQDEGDGYETAGRGTLISCERPPYTLSVVIDCCLQFVTSEPPGISCPPDCTEPYPTQTVVRLRTSSSTAYWQGCDSTDGGICTVTMTADRQVRL